METSTNKDHWQQLGGRYSLNWEGDSRQDISRKEREFVARNVPRDSASAVLDVGVGNGRILESLLALPWVSDVCGIDIAESMIESCRERHGGNPKLRWLKQCDIAFESLPVDEPLQFISAVRVLKYMPNWWEIVRSKLIPMLAPGGVLVFSMPNRNSVKRLSRPYAIQYEMTTEAELRARLQSLDVDVVEIAGFSKLPDLVHRRCTRPWSTQLVMHAEDVLAKPLGEATLSTELFVAVQRRP